MFNSPLEACGRRKMTFTIVSVICQKCCIEVWTACFQWLLLIRSGCTSSCDMQMDIYPLLACLRWSRSCCWISGRAPAGRLIQQSPPSALEVWCLVSTLSLTESPNTHTPPGSRSSRPLPPARKTKTEHDIKTCRDIQAHVDLPGNLSPCIYSERVYQ